VNDGFMPAAPHAGPRPDHEPAVGGRLRYPEARRQGSPRAPADQHVDDRREQRLIRRVLLSAALRPYLVLRDQRPCELLQAVRNNPTPRTPPHTQTNERSPYRTPSYPALGRTVTAYSPWGRSKGDPVVLVPIGFTEADRLHSSLVMIGSVAGTEPAHNLRRGNGFVVTTRTRRTPSGRTTAPVLR
jgi:hypothetical protein